MPWLEWEPAAVTASFVPVHPSAHTVILPIMQLMEYVSVMWHMDSASPPRQDAPPTAFKANTTTQQPRCASTASPSTPTAIPAIPPPAPPVDLAFSTILTLMETTSAETGAHLDTDRSETPLM